MYMRNEQKVWIYSKKYIVCICDPIPLYVHEHKWKKLSGAHMNARKQRIMLNPQPSSLCLLQPPSSHTLLQQSEELEVAVRALLDEKEHRLERLVDLESKMEELRNSLVIQESRASMAVGDISLQRIQKLSRRVEEYQRERSDRSGRGGRKGDVSGSGFREMRRERLSSPEGANSEVLYLSVFVSSSRSRYWRLSPLLSSLPPPPFSLPTHS